MANFVFNIAKGSAAYYAAQAQAGNGALIAVPIMTTGLEADATLQDYANLSVLLAASNDEQTTMGRKVLTSPTTIVDNINNRADSDFADPVWTAASGASISAIIVCYRPAAGSADTAIVPLTKHDFVVAPNGTDLTAVVAAAGFFRAS